MRIQFTIRFLMFATLAVAIATAFCAREYRRRAQRLQAIVSLEKDPAGIVFRDSGGGIPIIVTDNVRHGALVESIYLAGMTLDSVTLESLSLLDEVQSLSFNSSDFSDRHVRYLDSLVNLKHLQLNGTLITQSGLSHLSKKHRLTKLSLNDTGIGDEAIDAILAMETLQVLRIHKTKLTESGLSRLSENLPRCRIER